MKAAADQGLGAVLSLFVIYRLFPLFEVRRPGAYTVFVCGLVARFDAGEGWHVCCSVGEDWSGWGVSPRKDILSAMKSVEDDRTRYVEKFWDRCEEQWKPPV